LLATPIEVGSPVSGFSVDTRQDPVRGGSQDETDDSFIPPRMKKEFAGTKVSKFT
jgi:hypothetical protein